MGKTKQVLTTGEVARICRVAPRTVSKWFDNGQLRGYRIPGSRDRRIPLEQLVRFMKVHGIPMDEIEAGDLRVLIVDPDADLTSLLRRVLTESARFEVRVAASAFEAGAVLEEFDPAVVLVDIDLPGTAPEVLTRYVASRPDLGGTTFIAMSASINSADREVLRRQGFTEAIAKPFNIRQLITLIDETRAAMV